MAGIGVAALGAGTGTSIVAVSERTTAGPCIQPGSGLICRPGFSESTNGAKLRPVSSDGSLVNAPAASAEKTAASNMATAVSTNLRIGAVIFARRAGKEARTSPGVVKR